MCQFNKPSIAKYSNTATNINTMQRDKCYEQHPRATASSGSTAVVGSTATVPVFRPGGLVLDEAYGNFVELLHFCSHSSLLVIIQFPSLLCEAIVEVICDVSTCRC